MANFANNEEKYYETLPPNRIQSSDELTRNTAGGKKSKKQRKVKKQRKTKKRIYGGNILGNILGNIIGEDKNIKEYYYETKVKVKDKEYKINYFTPNNFLFVKNTDQIITPKFFLYLDKNANTPADITMKIDKYVVNSIVKIKKNNNWLWYVITRTLENIKNLNIKPVYYKINSGILSNDNEKLYITENNYQNINNTVILDRSTYNPVKDTDDAFAILANFDIQQNVKAAAKEEAGLAAGFGLFAIADEL